MRANIVHETDVIEKHENISDYCYCSNCHVGVGIGKKLKIETDPMSPLLLNFECI